MARNGIQNHREVTTCIFIFCKVIQEEKVKTMYVNQTHSIRMREQTLLGRTFQDSNPPNQEKYELQKRSSIDGN